MNVYTLSQVKFARPETEKAKAQRLSSFKYLEQKKAEEPWTNVQFFNLQVKVPYCLLHCCDKFYPNHCFCHNDDNDRNKNNNSNNCHYGY